MANARRAMYHARARAHNMHCACARISREHLAIIPTVVKALSYCATVIALR